MNLSVLERQIACMNRLHRFRREAKREKTGTVFDRGVIKTEIKRSDPNPQNQSKWE